MSYRLTKIYTRQGDEGYTSLRNQKWSKDDSLVDALGTVDELNASIGLILTNSITNSTITSSLESIQNDLFDLGAELHLPDRVAISGAKITVLENVLDGLNANLEPLKEFILPGGNEASARAHFARTVCRRTERTLVKLHRTQPINPDILRYINRLSDLLFVIARVLNKENEGKEVLWDTSRHEKGE
jgi:cob(I)alamin adenosyltransferase